MNDPTLEKKRSALLTRGTFLIILDTMALFAILYIKQIIGPLATFFLFWTIFVCWLALFYWLINLYYTNEK